MHGRYRRVGATVLAEQFWPDDSLGWWPLDVEPLPGADRHGARVGVFSNWRGQFALFQGDYVITFADGRREPISRDEFEASYEPIPEARPFTQRAVASVVRVRARDHALHERR